MASQREYREVVSGGTHLVAVLLSALGLAYLVVRAAQDATAWHVVGFAIFGASLILLYLASTLYHIMPWPEERKRILRRIDHVMIYVLIAGTYTPVCLTALRGPWGWSIFGVVWGLAGLGILFKTKWLDAPRWLSTVLYVVMGWTAVVAFVPLVDAVTVRGVLWMIAGGVLYTVGAAVYAIQWPTINRRHFTFHELFHVWVMGGSLAHFWFMHEYILPAAV